MIEETLKKPSVCPLDCPDSCTLEVSLDPVSGALISVAGDERNPLTGGGICGKVRRFGERLAAPERLTAPWIRRAGSSKGRGSFPRDFKQVTWDVAMDAVAVRFAAVDGEQVLPISYGGSNGVLTEGLVDERLWRRIGAARLNRNVCATPSGAAAMGQLGKMPGADLRDHINANLIIVWGCNPHTTGMHYVTLAAEAQKRGAKLVVVDPRETALAKKADMHLAPRPGTDLVLALAMLREIFERGWQDDEFLAKHASGADELRSAARAFDVKTAAAETGIDGGQILALIEMYRTAEVAVIRLGWGLERNRNGASACAAIMALPSVMGKWGVRGGGLTSSMGRAFTLNKEAALGAKLELGGKQVRLSSVGRALADFEIAFVYNCNPLAILPDQKAVIAGFGRADLFTVVSEQVANDTVDFADVVLPATTFLEHEELRSGYGTPFIGHSQAALEPAGAARHNAVMFGDLIARLGLYEDGDLVEPADLAERILADSDLTHAERESLALSGGTLLDQEIQSGEAPIPFVDYFPRTSDQRVHLFPISMPGIYEYQPDPATAEFPLAMISPAHLRMTSSTFGETLEGPVPIAMHSVDLASRGLSDGDPVRVFNGLGEVLTFVATSREAPRPGTIVLPKGLWRRHTANGLTSNALIPDTLSDFGQGSCYNDARVQVEKR